MVQLCYSNPFGKIATNEARCDAPEDRADPIDPPTLPLSRDDRRPKTAGRVRARAGNRRFETNHNGIERREDRRREWADRMESKEDAQQRNHDERGKRLPQQRSFDRITCSRPRCAEANATPHHPPRQQWQRTEDRTQELGDDIPERCGQVQLAHQAKGHRDDRIDMRPASLSHGRESNHSPGCAEEETCNNSPQRLASVRCKMRFELEFAAICAKKLLEE